MRINLSSAVLLLNLMQVLAIVKETISYDAKGQVIRYKFITLNIIYLKIYLIHLKIKGK